MEISAKTTNANSINARTLNASLANFLAASSPSPSRLLENIGTNAAAKAPSANNRLNKFGNRNATTKASATAPAPKNCATKISRTKPKTRLNIVIEPIADIARTRFMFRVYNRIEASPWRPTIE